MIDLPNDNYGMWQLIFSYTIDNRVYNVWRTAKGLFLLFEELNDPIWDHKVYWKKVKIPPPPLPDPDPVRGRPGMVSLLRR